VVKESETDSAAAGESVLLTLGAFSEGEVLWPQTSHLDIEVLRRTVGIQGREVEFGLSEQRTDRVDIGTFREPVFDGVAAQVVAILRICDVDSPSVALKLCQVSADQAAADSLTRA
jgi:hypothetical protein